MKSSQCRSSSIREGVLGTAEVEVGIVNFECLHLYTGQPSEVSRFISQLVQPREREV